jgi:transposase
LIALAEARPDWLVGFQDETWWSRVARPQMAAWAADGRPLRLVEQQLAADDPEPKALACYGLWLPAREEMWLRFVDGRPVSAITTQFLGWCAAAAVPEDGIRTLVLIWDNASWHTSRTVRQWLRAHNQAVQRAGAGVKLVPCPLPSKSPWLNPIEPKWRYAKRYIVEPERSLTLAEVEERVCQVLDCPQRDHLSLSKDVA